MVVHDPAVEVFEVSQSGTTAWCARDGGNDFVGGTMMSFEAPDKSLEPEKHESENCVTHGETMLIFSKRDHIGIC